MGSTAPAGQIPVRRVFSDPDADVVTAVYEAQMPGGSVRITRQFYAAGPSLFEWEVSGPGAPELASFATLKAARRWLYALSGAENSTP